MSILFDLWIIFKPIFCNPHRVFGIGPSNNYVFFCCSLIYKSQTLGFIFKFPYLYSAYNAHPKYWTVYMYICVWERDNIVLCLNLSYSSTWSLVLLLIISRCLLGRFGVLFYLGIEFLCFRNFKFLLPLIFVIPCVTR